jgi:hypothetical protein
MPRLADLQAEFAAALADPTRPPPADLGREAASPQSRRFDVHRNNSMVSLIEALATSFPVVRRLVGEDFFRAAARAYVRQDPPRSPVLLLYGRGFGDFLDDFEPARGVPYLGDVARLEWARVHAYNAADADPVGIDRLAAVPEAVLPRTRLVLHLSLRLLRSRFPVAALWAATRGDAPDTDVDMTRGEDVAVLRPADSVEVRVLPAGGHDFIAALAAGAPLGAATAESRAEFDLAQHLQGLFALGAVTAVQPPDPGAQDGEATRSWLD